MIIAADQPWSPAPALKKGLGLKKI